jgi:hypothetical protein
MVGFPVIRNWVKSYLFIGIPGLHLAGLYQLKEPPNTVRSSTESYKKAAAFLPPQPCLLMMLTFFT